MKIDSLTNFVTLPSSIDKNAKANLLLSKLKSLVLVTFFLGKPQHLLYDTLACYRHFPNTFLKKKINY